jgi:hypothetical protein
MARIGKSMLLLTLPSCFLSGCPVYIGESDPECLPKDDWCDGDIVKGRQTDSIRTIMDCRTSFDTTCIEWGGGAGCLLSETPCDAEVETTCIEGNLCDCTQTGKPVFKSDCSFEGYCVASEDVPESAFCAYAPGTCSPKGLLKCVDAGSFDNGADEGYAICENGVWLTTEGCEIGEQCVDVDGGGADCI